MGVIDKFDPNDAGGRVYVTTILANQSLSAGVAYEIPEAERTTLDVTKDIAFSFGALAPGLAGNTTITLYFEFSIDNQTWYPFAETLELSLSASSIFAYDNLIVGDLPYLRLWKVMSSSQDVTLTVYAFWKDSGGGGVVVGSLTGGSDEGTEVVITGQTIELRTTLANSESQRAVLTSSTTVTAGTPWTSDWMRVSAKRDIGWVLIASSDSKFWVYVVGSPDQTTVYEDQPFLVMYDPPLVNEYEFAVGTSPISIYVPPFACAYPWYRLKVVAGDSDVTLTHLPCVLTP